MSGQNGYRTAAFVLVLSLFGIGLASFASIAASRLTGPGLKAVASSLAQADSGRLFDLGHSPRAGLLAAYGVSDSPAGRVVLVIRERQALLGFTIAALYTSSGRCVSARLVEGQGLGTSEDIEAIKDLLSHGQDGLSLRDDEFVDSGPQARLAIDLMARAIQENADIATAKGE